MGTQISYETKVALYLASQFKAENIEIARRQSEQAVSPAAAFLDLKAKELYWTVTRLLGLAYLHDGSRSRRVQSRLVL
jgi:hypothetical protein